MSKGPTFRPLARPLLSGWLVLILVGCIILLGVIAIGASRSLDTLTLRGDWVTHTERVRYEIGRILQLLTDVETGERGYVLSGDESFLEPYQRAQSSLDHDLEALGNLTADNPVQRANIGILSGVVHERLGQARSVIERVRNGDSAGARANIAAGEARQTMDAARLVVTRMQDEESRLLQRRGAEDAQARSHTTALFWTLGVLAVFLVALIALVTSRDAARRYRTERELAATLRSVGDAIISTDARGIVRFMNPVAEGLTGWTQRDARGQPLERVFRIVNEQTRATVDSPVGTVMREGTVVGLANHTILLARDGREVPIEDSGAPVFGASGALEGVVLVFRDASAERAAQRAILESEQRFRGAIEAIQGVLWTNTALGEMRGEQPGWAALTGQSQEEYQGLGWSGALHPDDAQPTIDAWFEAVRERKPFRFEHRVRDRAGQWRLFSIQAIPLLDFGGAIREWVGVHTDITDRREIERQLSERERRFAALADSIPQLAWTNRADGSHEFFNRQWLDYTGLSVAESMPTQVWERVVHPDDFPHSNALWREVLTTGEPYEAEFRMRRHDGDYRWFLTRANADRDASGRIIEWFGTCTDIDVSKRTEESLRHTEASLREADLRKDVFLATLSHELRNPLAPIRTAARLLEMPTLSAEDLEKSRAVITRQVRHMASLLEDLLDVSRITRGDLTLKQQSVDLQQRIFEAIETAQPLLDAHEHRLTMQLPAQPIQIEADPVRLVQIIANLLTNAAKYSPPRADIRLQVEVQDGTLALSVCDSGIGIAPQNLAKVFEMFTRISSPEDRSEAGLGIGLALVKGLVELHGGRVSAYSEGIGRGSEFRVFLPQAAASVVAASAPQVLTDTGRQRVEGSRILVADDNRDAAETLGMLLGVSGYEVDVCHDGLEALARIGAGRPSIAILDIGMPGLNGFEVARRVRAEVWGEQIRLIALTGWGQQEDQDAARAAGFDHHLTKPVDLPELENVIASMLQAQSASATPAPLPES